MNTFGQKLKAIRLDRGMSLEEMGRLLGTSKQVLSRYENGLREPKINTVTRYAERLGVNVCDLLSGQGPPPSTALLQTRVIVTGGGKEKTYCIDGKVADLICGLLDRLGK